MSKIFKKFGCLSLLALCSLSACASHPNCDDPENWAPSMAFVHLKNAGLLDNKDINFSKTSVKRIASEKIGKGLYLQVHKVAFFRRDETVINVITQNKASNNECSEGPVTVYLVTKILGSGSA